MATRFARGGGATRPLACLSNWLDFSLDKPGKNKKINTYNFAGKYNTLQGSLALLPLL